MNLHRLDLAQFLPADSAAVINPSLYKTTSFDTLKDFEPISPVATAGHVLVANNAFPPKNVAGTPKVVIDQLQAAVAKALDAVDTREKLATVGCEPFKATQEQFAALVKADLPKWARIVKDSGATID